METKWVVYAENYGVLRLWEDGFDTRQLAHDCANELAAEGGNYEVYGFGGGEPPLEIDPDNVPDNAIS